MLHNKYNGKTKYHCLHKEQPILFECVIIPPLVVYCFGIFGLMMLSLLETILVMYLMGKDSASQDNEAGKDQSLREDCNKQGKAKGGEFNCNKQGSLYMYVWRSPNLPDICNLLHQLKIKLKSYFPCLTWSVYIAGATGQGVTLFCSNSIVSEVHL